MKGYFGVGVENISKAMNLGSLVRSAHAFGASFFFTVNARYTLRDLRRSDTTKATQNLPLYDFCTFDDLILPRHCQTVGIELTDHAIELPSFRHPRCAAYILGPERGSLSHETLQRCDHVIKIPTQFCLNLALAGAIAMYDRVQSMRNFPNRPLRAGGPDSIERHDFGMPIWHKRVIKKKET